MKQACHAFLPAYEAQRGRRGRAQAPATFRAAARSAARRAAGLGVTAAGNPGGRSDA
ncbi:hypothetical protein GCM10018779_47960 [Streptomyces griseocarneus]|nr:hypothetical protein [Streptomyces griseocarneus]GHG72529.1 hypothetical protein GCM10018779_47960 [Streptomyces griseocarneus]